MPSKVLLILSACLTVGFASDLMEAMTDDTKCHEYVKYICSDEEIMKKSYKCCEKMSEKDKNLTKAYHKKCYGVNDMTMEEMRNMCKNPTQTCECSKSMGMEFMKVERSDEDMKCMMDYMNCQQGIYDEYKKNSKD